MDKYKRLKRLEKRLNSSYILDSITGCWIGKYATDSNGYCQFYMVEDGKERTRALHIVMYEKEFGKVPYGYELHHKCNRKRCCNPLHLQPVTKQEHVLLRDNLKLTEDDVGAIKLAIANGKTHDQVASEFNITRAYVTNIVNGNRRKYVR